MVAPFFLLPWVPEKQVPSKSSIRDYYMPFTLGIIYVYILVVDNRTSTYNSFVKNSYVVLH